MVTVKNEQLQIDSNDVYSCTDLTILFMWRRVVAETYHTLCEKIYQARAKVIETGEYANRNWYNNINSARRLQEILLFQIEEQIQKIKLKNN